MRERRNGGEQGSHIEVSGRDTRGEGQKESSCGHGHVDVLYGVCEMTKRNSNLMRQTASRGSHSLNTMVPCQTLFGKQPSSLSSAQIVRIRVASPERGDLTKVIPIEFRGHVEYCIGLVLTRTHAHCGHARNQST